LRFYLYFKEAVHESAVENHRVRRCTLYFYLEDDSIRIEEPKEENSGLPQGVFLNRTKLYKPGTCSETYDPSDFMIGNEVNIFSRHFRVVDMDKKTRDYFAERGIQAPDAESCPEDPHRKKLRAMQAAKNNKVESITGRKKPDTLGKYLKNDKQALRFHVLWDDANRLYGKKNFYQLCYYLSDDTIEIRAMNNSQPFPCLIKRTKLEKDRLNPGQGFYQAEDLICGEFINCYARHMLILRCSDSFTQKYYKRVHDFDQPVVKIQEPPRKVIKNTVPPYNGFGSEADSLANCLNLIPKPVCQDLQRFLNNQGKVLEFHAKFTDPKPEDRDRRFVITYYMDDDTCAVYEPIKRNSGIMGGKFLERNKYKKPMAPKKNVNKELQGLKQLIVEKIHSRMVGGPYNLLRAFRSFGADSTGCIDFSAFKEGLRKSGFNGSVFSDAKLAELFNAYDISGDGRIDYQEFVDNVMQDKPIATNTTNFQSRWLRGSDFYVGAKIKIMFPQTGATTQEFEILRATSNTLNLMTEHPDDFPKSNVEAIAAKLAETLQRHHVNVIDEFRRHDTEGRGWIDPKQFGAVLNQWSMDFGLVEDELKEHEKLTLTRHYDRDGDNRIYYNEFMDALRSAQKIQAESSETGMTVEEGTELLLEKLQNIGQNTSAILERFSQIDTDGSGKISWDEFRTMLTGYGIELNSDLDKSLVMIKFDKNSDGLIDYREFTDSLFTALVVREGGQSQTKRIPRPISELNKLNQSQDETITPRMLEYQAVLRVAQQKEAEHTQLKHMMSTFTSLFKCKLKLLIKKLRAFDVDNTGAVTRNEFIEALTSANPDYANKEKLALLAYVLRDRHVLYYDNFIEIMTSQDVNKAINTYGHLEQAQLEEYQLS